MSTEHRPPVPRPRLVSPSSPEVVESKADAAISDVRELRKVVVAGNEASERRDAAINSRLDTLTDEVRAGFTHYGRAGSAHSIRIAKAESRLAAIAKRNAPPALFVLILTLGFKFLERWLLQ